MQVTRLGVYSTSCFSLVHPAALAMSPGYRTWLLLLPQHNHTIRSFVFVCFPTPFAHRYQSSPTTAVTYKSVCKSSGSIHASRYFVIVRVTCHSLDRFGPTQREIFYTPVQDVLSGIHTFNASYIRSTKRDWGSQILPSPRP